MNSSWNFTNLIISQFILWTFNFNFIQNSASKLYFSVLFPVNLYVIINLYILLLILDAQGESTLFPKKRRSFR